MIASQRTVPVIICILAGFIHAAQAATPAWEAPVVIASSTGITTAFNNAQPMMRARDGGRVFAGYKTSSQLRLAVLEDSAIVVDHTVSALSSATGLTIEDTPAGEIWLAYTTPAGLYTHVSANGGTDLGAETPFGAAGTSPSAPSLSFAGDGTGFLVWHEGGDENLSAMLSLRDAGDGSWSEPLALDNGVTR